MKSLKMKGPEQDRKESEKKNEEKEEELALKRRLLLTWVVCVLLVEPLGGKS